MKWLPTFGQGERPHDAETEARLQHAVSELERITGELRQVVNDYREGRASDDAVG